MKIVHNLKTVNPYFNDCWKGIKHFELRKDDRGFKVKDEIVLREYDVITGIYSGRQINGEITYIIKSFPGLTDGFVVFGFKKLDRLVPFGTQ